MLKRDRLAHSSFGALRQLTAIALLAGAAAAQQPRAAHDWSAVDRALGRKGAEQPGGVMKYGFPRSDLKVTVGDVAVRPALALGSWVAFADVGGGQTMVMGDLVLTEDEVGPVLAALQQGGVQQTAVHNHLLHESPRVLYVHIAARGDAAKIATTIHGALAATATPLAAPAPAPAAAAIDLDTASIARALGVAGKVNGGVYQVSVPRRETVRERGHEVSPSMGVATAINFQPLGGGRAAIAGDFVMRASEVNAVIRAFQQAGIAVTALHSHMLDEEPRLFFMHFWATGDATTLARGLHGALAQMAVKLAAK